MIRIFNFIWVLTICYSTNAQNKKCFDYQFIGNYVFADRLIIGDAVLSIENQTYTFGTFDKNGNGDTSWTDPFIYRLVGNNVYILKNGEEYLQYSDRVGDTVYSLFEYISPSSDFIATRFVEDYMYKRRKCLFFENCKEDKNSHNKTTVICILDKNFGIPLYYEIAMYKSDKLSVRLIYFSDLVE
jgi:hypothetical protein